jgi:hypothetical protein
MESDQNQNQSQSLFGMNIDDAIKFHLNETARWGKFLAIIGFILCGLVVIAGIVLAASTNSISRYSGFYERNTMREFGPAMSIAYIIFAVIYFFPCLFLLRFSDKMKIALSGNDQITLTASFQNLKILFRYVGILTIIFLSIYLLALLMIVMTGR